MIRYRCRLFMVLFFLATPFPAFSADWSNLAASGSNQPWHITADQISYDQDADQYQAFGNVLIARADRKISADSVRFDHKNMRALAQGNVVMVAGDDIITGSRLEIDLKSERGVIYDSSIFLRENHFYINGDRIEKVGPETYAAQKAVITTCDGANPDWRITSRSLKVTVEGYGHAKHVALWAKNIPVLYTPYMFFPFKRKRQTGLLAPQFGHSDRKGFEYQQPFFWAINDSSDATFYLDYMSERGEKLGLEYRYVLDPASKGTFMFDFLQDQKVDDGTGSSSADWGYTDDSVLRPNADRYWLRMKHDQDLPNGFKAYLDLDIVSDQDYLSEFRSGYTGFDATENYFNNVFGRQIDDATDSVRVNRLNISKSWSSYSLNSEIRWYDNVIARTQHQTNSIIQRLPFVEFYGLKQQLFQSPLFFDLDSEYSNLYRLDGQSAHRTDIHPRVYYPTLLGNYFSFEPSVGVRETAWYVYNDPSSGTSDRESFYRSLYDVKLDLSSEIFRVFNVNGERVDKIKHSLIPQIVYDFIPEVDQSEYPSFTDLDRIDHTSSITYSITNLFTAKTINPKTSGAVLESQKEKAEPGYSYRQFARLELSQSYDLLEAGADKTDRRPFSDITLDLQFDPVRYLSLQVDADWSPYDHQFVSHNEMIRLLDNRGDYLSLEHRYTRDASESIYANLYLKLTPQLAAIVEYEVDLYTDENILSSLGFSYQKQCWAFDIRYVDEPAANDKRIEFAITLYGLGQFGSQFSGGL